LKHALIRTLRVPAAGSQNSNKNKPPEPEPQPAPHQPPVAPVASTQSQKVAGDLETIGVELQAKHEKCEALIYGSVDTELDVRPAGLRPTIPNTQPQSWAQLMVLWLLRPCLLPGGQIASTASRDTRFRDGFGRHCVLGSWSRTCPSLPEETPHEKVRFARDGNQSLVVRACPFLLNNDRHSRTRAPRCIIRIYHTCTVIEFVGTCSPPR
jgi:hypothetical protein